MQTQKTFVLSVYIVLSTLLGFGCKPPENASPSSNLKGKALSINNSIGMKLVFIPPGEFLMGSPINEKGRSKRELQHRVRLTKGFYMGSTEVTQKQWKAVMGADNNPSEIKGDDLPVESITWDNAQDFCNKLSIKEGKVYRLPTEAEWEYACRAGSTTSFNTGEIISTEQANYNGTATQDSKSKGLNREKTTPVGSFKPNAWGLYDMHGNVWEWCQDWDSPFSSGPGIEIDPQGPKEGKCRILRGGSWIDDQLCCRSAFRWYTFPDFYLTHGLRVVLTD